MSALRGLGVKYVLDNGPDVDPLSPDNLICIMNGPLSGTEVKMSGRLCVVTKSPLTGTVTDSHMGGWTAAKLKWAGFDGLLIQGKAESPVYLYVENGEVSIHDATAIWGMETDGAVRYLQSERGDDCSVMAIGPAGEHLVKFANWMNENERSAGRGVRARWAVPRISRPSSSRVTGPTSPSRWTGRPSARRIAKRWLPL